MNKSLQDLASNMVTMDDGLSDQLGRIEQASENSDRRRSDELERVNKALQALTTRISAMGEGLATKITTMNESLSSRIDRVEITKRQQVVPVAATSPTVDGSWHKHIIQRKPSLPESRLVVRVLPNGLPKEKRPPTTKLVRDINETLQASAEAHHIRVSSVEWNNMGNAVLVAHIDEPAAELEKYIALFGRLITGEEEFTGREDVWEEAGVEQVEDNWTEQQRWDDKKQEVRKLESGTRRHESMRSQMSSSMSSRSSMSLSESRTRGSESAERRRGP
jgi:hypothetical protein